MSEIKIPFMNPVKLLAAVCLVCLILPMSCGLKHSAATATILPDNVSLSSTPYVPVVIVKHDTIKPQTKHLTPKQIQDQLEPYYRANYDRIFAPELKKMSSTIANLSESNQKILELFATSRANFTRRMDSIRKDDNDWKTKFIKKDSELIAVSKKTLSLEQSYEHKNDAQINLNTVLAVSCLTGVVVLGVAWLLIYLQVRSLSKKINREFPNV